jgi:hypothetical protein
MLKAPRLLLSLFDISTQLFGVPHVKLGRAVDLYASIHSFIGHAPLYTVFFTYCLFFDLSGLGWVCQCNC